MRKIIIGIPLCHKCETLKTQCPDIDAVTVQPNDLLPLARAAGLREMPFVVVTGDVEELKKMLQEGK